MSGNNTRQYGELIKIGTPVIIGQLGTIVLGFADTLMIGHHSTNELAAAGLVNNVFALVLLFYLGFSYGLTPIVGQLYGVDRKEEIGSKLKNAIPANLLTGLLLMTLMTVLYFNLAHIGQPSELLPLIRPYFIVNLVSLPFVGVFNTLKQFFDGTTRTGVPMWVMIGGNLFNILFNWLLIYGKGGFPEMGLLGAGIATMASRILMALSLCAILFWAKSNRVYRLGMSNARINKADFREMNRMGFPVALLMGMETAAFSLSSVMAGWLGTLSLAAHQVMITTSQLFYLILLGMAAAVSIRISLFTGQKKLRGGSPHCRRRLPSESYGFVRNVNTFAYFPKLHRHIFHRQRGSGKYGGGTLHSACGLSVWRWIAVHICQRAQGNSLRKTYGALRISGILRNKPAVGIFHGLYPQARNYRHLGGVSIRAFGGGFAVLAQIPTRTEENGSRHKRGISILYVMEFYYFRSIMRNPVKYLIIMAAMFCTVAAKAQNMEKLFGEMPDSIVPVMSKTNRLDCIDFFKSKMTSNVQNIYNGKSRISDLTENFLVLQPTTSSQVEMRTYDVEGEGRIIAVAYTYMAPAKETTLAFYDMSWKKLKTADYISLPKKNDFISESSTSRNGDIEKAKEILNDAFVFAEIDKDSGNISFALSTEAVTDDKLKKALPYIARPPRYAWNGKKFVLL